MTGRQRYEGLKDFEIATLLLLGLGTVILRKANGS